MEKHKCFIGSILILLLCVGCSGCINLGDSDGMGDVYYTCYFSCLEKTVNETNYLYVYAHMKVKNEDFEYGVSTLGDDWILNVKNVKYFSFNFTGNKDRVYPGEDYNFTITYRLNPGINITYAYLTYHNQDPDHVCFLPYHKMN